MTPFQTSPDLFLYTYNNGNNSVLIPQNSFIDSLNSYQNVGTIAQRFCWSPTCEDISTIPYDFSVRAFSLGCSGRVEDTLNFKIEVGEPNDQFDVIPNVFTPNNDGMNDTYKVDGITNLVQMRYP